MKRFAVILLICTLILPLGINSAFAANAENKPFDVDTKAAILIDSGTGTLLYGKNIHEKLPPASVTKVMTLYLVLEAVDSGKIKLNDTVQVSEHASSMGGSQIYLAPGEEMNVQDMIKAVTVSSANDASVALAEHIDGSEQLFVEKMNEKAHEFGLKDTNFVNATGLPGDNHYTSVYDIAVISKRLLNDHPSILKYSSIWMDTVRNGKFGLANTNKLIRTYGADGLKTGSTDEAKFCLSATKKTGDTRLVAVIFGAPNSKTRFNETAKLLDYGFANFETYNLYKKNEKIGNITVDKGNVDSYDAKAPEDISILIKKGERDNITKSAQLIKKIKAPVKRGYVIGKIVVKDKDRVIKKIPIKLDKQISEASTLDMIKRIYKSWLRF
jgi:D-alanyl-D-alanine carboxypeptidase (penicillin-binding protein 5/6)